MITETGSKPKRGKTSTKVSHNLVGQKLGRKGQDTRNRILKAMLDLVEHPSDTDITLSAVAREASVGMTTLYLYFADLGDLLLAALNQVMDTSDAAYMDQLRTRWPDERLGECCYDFLKSHFQFWQRHARLLHMRNAFADNSDERLVEYRQQVSFPLIDQLMMQMDFDKDNPDPVTRDYATIFVTSFERVATVLTNPKLPTVTDDSRDEFVDNLLRAEAEIMEASLRKRRDIQRARSA